MLLSLLVYSLTGAILFFLGWHVNKREQQSLIHGGNKLPFYSWEIMLSLVVFSIVAGARYHTGYDHAMYLDQYQHLLETGDFSRHNFEYGFVWISKIFAWCHIHYFYYFAFWALLQIGFLYFGLRNHKHLLCWVGLGLMCGPFFLSWMNSVRQSVVVCLFVALVSLINNRSSLQKNILLLIFILCVVVLAAFIHKSALMLLPVFLILFLILILTDDFNIHVSLPNKWVMLSVFAVFVLLGLKPFWIDYFSNYQWFLDLTGYQNYSNLDDPNVAGKFRTLNWGPSRVSILCSNILIIWFYPKMKALFKDDRLLPFFFVLSFVGMCLSNLLINTSHFLLRPIDYFTIFYLVMNSYLMIYFIRTKNMVFTVAVFLLLYSHFLFSIYKGVFMPIDTNLPFLYHTFLLPSI
ncbi:MAG: EpsG family protein [Muribaculaceae bacterium]|nr:EpsG family protein [Muribaculaceae bacterium]